ncbi:N-acyl homoserine lactonase family protein [Microbacterium indicum]|uniref:N-acyl homoserine lactonase family protein n=1 Tax=Microbacterium indicum TaxID=358100 RepID=UPI00042A6071|nr:N-acyl homoserine lactonase family protein [Microbacterium indicum]
MPDLAVVGRPQRLIPFVLAYEAVSEAMSVAGGSDYRWLLEPVTAAAIEFEKGWVLVDGGFDPRRIRDREARLRSFGYENYAPVVPAGDPLVDQVAAARLEWADCAGLVLTHAHFDHTGGIRMLEPHQPLMLQRGEHDYARTVEDQRSAFLFRDDIIRAGVTTTLLDGDAELADGLQVIDTAGHTPGHQSVVIELSDETVVLAGDAADLRSNIEGGRPCGSTVGLDGERRAKLALERLAELDRLPGVAVWPSHDPDWEPWRRAIDREVGRRAA